MKIGQSHALAMELVEMGRLEHRIAVAGKIAVALIIGYHKDYVGRSR
jgi:hypothetical protein